MQAPVPGVGAVIFDDADRLLMVRRGEGAAAGSWSVPGGKVELGETLVEAVVREVREETGLEVEVGEVAWVGEAIGPGEPPAWHYVLVDFRARVLGGELAASGDAAEVEWVPVDEIGDRPVTSTLWDLLEALGRA